MRALIAVTALVVMSFGFAAAAQSPDALTKATDAIWAKEKAIYADRGTGGDYYPFRRDRLQGSVKPAGAPPTKETITNAFTDFSLEVDVATARAEEIATVHHWK